jgi:hypothetical protein
MFFTSTLSEGASNRGRASNMGGASIMGRGLLIRINNSQNQETYMKKGIYLKVNKFVQLSDILQEENDIHRKNKPKWQCKNKRCEESNEGGVKICLHCYTNRSRTIIRGLSYIPVLEYLFLSLMLHWKVVELFIQKNGAIK